MDREAFDASRRYAGTSSGTIAYVERGEGPAAVFCHAALLNGYQWRDVLDRCSEMRRSIAFDNLGHGHTKTRPEAAVDFAGHARMLDELVDALDIDQVDLVGNDSGGAIAQTFAAHFPHRVRSLTLTDCDAQDSSPPPSLRPLLDIVRQGALAQALDQVLGDIELARQPSSIGGLYEHPELTQRRDHARLHRPRARRRDHVSALERFLLALAVDQMAAIEPQLGRLDAPTLIAWGTLDTTFELTKAYWLADIIPGAKPVVEIDGANLLWPEERPEQLAKLLLDHWMAAD